MIEKIKGIMYKGAEDIRERLFRMVLAMGLIVAVFAIVAGLALDNPLINALPICGLLVIILIAAVLTFKYHKVDLASMIFALFVVCGMFPFVFFTSGGIEGGAAVWFVLGLLYIFIMFRGISLLIFIALAVIADIATYVIAYRNPQLIRALASKTDVYYDSVFAVIAVGIAVGFIVLFQIRAYEKERERTIMQKNEIEKISKSKDAFLQI